MDSYQTAILVIVGSVMLVGGVLLASVSSGSTAAITVDSNQYGYASNPRFTRTDVRCAVNTNCPDTSLECCTTAGCACSVMSGPHSLFPTLPKAPTQPQAVKQ